ncbi:unnamed protein product [Linum tenue]|uniref:Cytoplasmic tRNA 2-thiolation protein 2 n=1 Tax=Linum tenue TaxID=586396 RepID=A0AAV0LYJ1_9ROSI|nr:unnamed protein product [Linum tenue]
MACNSGNCQSNCHQNEQVAENDSIPTPTTGSNDGGHQQQQGVCLKCKVSPPISSGSGGGGTGDEARFCADCFRANLFGKFRLAVTSHAMITPSDNVLVAFSGGVASRVALQFVHEMQQRAQKNYEASKDRSLPVFGVGVAFVDESSVCSISKDGVEEAIQEMKSTVSKLAPPVKQFHVVSSASLYSSGSSDEKDRLKKLIGAVDDVTGKDDLLMHLRMWALQKVASENGYTKLVLGLCTSRIACHVIAATVKDSLKPSQLVNDLPSGINGLISSFVRLLQEENPSRESTIVRTAGKLTPFHFNRVPEINDSNVPLATIRRQKRYNLKPQESISSESFCPICNSPVIDSNSPSWGSPKTCQFTEFASSCCSSCQFQILPQDQLSMKEFCSLLPERLVARSKPKYNGNLDMLREQIQDCLLSDSDGET